MSEEIIPVAIGEIVPRKFIDYAMSVIIERALPDVRDGLKPVHRRILYDMHELGIFYDGNFKKSARIVGDVLGKYHPHGDTSVYDAMVKQAQDFYERYPMVDGHGNFGSIDGDGAAAMRYTEAKFSRFGQAMLRDITKNTVDFVDNYDDNEKEPTVLPTLIPNLLVNGCFGIAVGLSTKIPPHNLHDIYNALYYIIDSFINGEEPDIDEVINIIKAPDFPTGGTIMGLSGIREAYKTGSGRILIRSKYHFEIEDGYNTIIIDEIPYGVNKLKLINSIRCLTKDEKNAKGTVVKKAKIPQIKEIIDESDKDGIRVSIKIKKGENVQLVLNNLIKHTQFQVSLNALMIALVDKVPKKLNILELLEYFLNHCSDVISRRTQFDLDKANKRLNIVDGLIRLSDDELLANVIQTIRESEDPVNDLTTLYGFNVEQANNVIETKLRRLSRLSNNKLLAEKQELENNIAEYNAILNDDIVLLNEIKKEFKELDDIFFDERRTVISNECEEINDEDLIDDETLVVTYTDQGMIKAVEESSYKSQKRGGKGSKATSVKDDEIIKFMLTASSKDDLLFFTTLGKCHVLKAYKISKSSKIAKGSSINNYLELEPGEKIVSILNTNIKNADDNNFLMMITKKGRIKKLALDQLSSRFSYTKVISFNEDDSLVQALLINSTDNILLVTKNGKSLRLDSNADKTKAIRPMGRSAAGVNGITLTNDDEVIDMCIVTDEDSILTITENGLGKRTKASEWKVQGRGGKGIIAHDITEKTGKIISVLTAKENDELFIATEQGIISRISVKEIREIRRSSKGVKIINLNENDLVASVSINKNQIEDDE